MLIRRERERLINAIIYFAANTQHCGKIKLIKLLYLLDFEHFRQTGRSVTGLDYQAWKLGPVPLSLFQEWDSFDADLDAAIEIRPEKVIDYTRETVVPKRAFDDAHFTKRELRLMAELAERLRGSYSKPMIDMTHDELGPWHTIWDSGRGINGRIPYSLAIPEGSPHREEILASADEFQSVAAAFG